MMSMSKIKCPKCGTLIEIDKALEDQVETRIKLELEEQHKKELAAAAKENDEKISAAKQQANDDAQKLIREMLEKETERIKKSHEQTIEELKKDKEADNKTNTELREKLNGLLEELRTEKKAREEAQLEANKKILEETGKIKEEEKKKADEAWELRYRQMEKQLEDTKTALSEAKKKAEQGSQQNQGEVLELELEQCLKNEFPYDEILDVKKGQRGADIKHLVKNFSEECGLILWETKNAAWQPSWIQKFKEDIRESNAVIGVLISVNVPESYGDISQVDGIWITRPRFALAVARLVRTQMLAVYAANKNSQNKDAKMEFLYQYLTGPEFKHRVEAIIDNYKMLKDELDKEKRATEKRWGKQEKAIEAVIRNTSGMYGDFQGLIGNALGEIKQLEPGNDEKE